MDNNISIVKRNTDGEITHYQGIIPDISDRKKMEKLLSDSEQRYHSMLENINDGVVVIQDGTVIIVNPQFAGMIGYKADEVIGMFYLDLVAPSHMELVRSRHNKRLEKNTTCPSSYKLVLISKHGDEVPVDINASYIEHAGKSATISIIRDITQRKRDEEKINRSLEIQKALALVSSTLLTSSDIEKAINISLSCIGNLCGASRAYIFLYDENGKHMSNTHEWCADGVVPHKVDLQELPMHTFPWWMQQLSSGEMIHITNVDDMPLEASAEKEILEMQNISSLLVLPLLIGKRTSGFIGLDNIINVGSWSREDIAIMGTVSHLLSNSIENDMKEVQLAENARELWNANVELKRTAKVKDAFLANMSHELRTPLNSIIGFSSVLLSGIAGVMNDKEVRYLNHISNSGKHLLEIINDILDISKVESGKMELIYEKVFVSDIIGSVINIVSPMADKKQINLNCDINPIGISVEADHVRFKQIVSNLVINAIKFSDERNDVSIIAKREGDLLNISVADTGIGITQEDQPKLFKPFQQLDSSNSRKYEGTGLGLALVKDLVESHGGHIWVESEPGKGSIFTFSIPIKRKCDA
ncbi:ATP-binding protein [Methanolobus sp. ZRKC5]|uniref:PAS domain-containing sensor histidine kinase n=1 Tax=unclassified Methanolobus TaxID=2629569 RepID=UPI00313E86CB